MKVPIACPEIGAEEKAAVLGVLESGRLIQDEQVRQLEDGFARLHDARFATATSNGTTALTAALLAHGVGVGDEVIVPAFSFFATASCVLGIGAIPILVDIHPETFTIDPELVKARIGPRTRAVLAVHLYGHAADLPVLVPLCREAGIALIEDAAQAHLSGIEGKRIGSSGTACFSFYASKNMTTGEGGMVLTDDLEVHRRMQMIRNQGRNRMGEHEVLGGNFRMTEMAAALGVAQLSRLQAWTELRVRNAAFYSEQLRRDDRLTLVRAPRVRPGFFHNFHQYTVELLTPLNREKVKEHLLSLGVEARVYYARGIHQEPVMTRRGLSVGHFPHTERAAKRVLSLPVHQGVTERQLEYVLASLVQAVGTSLGS